ncbi:MAG TPA: hypothetical protein VF591_18845 [Pyrinomonadaceae bacterium]|jgi:hypothetical protein
MKTTPDAALKTFHGRAVKRAAFAFIFAALLCASGARAQTSDPSEEVLETAGSMTLARRRDGEAVTILIKMYGAVVAEKSASPEGDAYTGASVFGRYPKASPKFAVVMLSTGSLVCGAKFTVVDWSRKEAGRVSEDFGNCSDSPRAVYRGETLTLTFPAGPKKHDPGAHYVGPGQVWTYSNGRLRRAGGRR